MTPTLAPAVDKGKGKANKPEEAEEEDDDEDEDEDEMEEDDDDDVSQIQMPKLPSPGLRLFTGRGRRWIRNRSHCHSGLRQTHSWN